MASKRLTDVGIERLAPPAEGRLEVWDALVPGLGLRVGGRRKSFFVITRVDGRQKRVTLGVHPALTIAAAREKARTAIAQAQNGEDPTALKRDEAAARKRRQAETAAALIELYIESYARPRQRSWRDTAGRLRTYALPILGDLPVASVTRADVVKVIDASVAQGLGVGANRLLANLKTFLNWCVDRGVIDRSPAERVRPPRAETPRDRVLTSEELATVWRAAEADGYPFGAIVRLLILTGQRRDEVATLRWADVDLASRTWTIPAERNKSARPHLVPLAPGAAEVLDALPQLGPLCFPSRNDLAGEGAFCGWGRAKRRLDARSGVTGWRLHDLRRTAASGMARFGVDPHIVERILNHATTSAGPLARVYQRYAYEDEKRKALERWAEEVAALTQPRRVSCLSRSSLVRPGRTPPSVSAFFTHSLSVCGAHPNIGASASIVANSEG